MKHKGNRPVNRARPGRDARREKALNFFCGAAGILTFLALWQLGATYSRFGRFIPGPIEVIPKFFLSFTQPIGVKRMGGHILASLARVAAGYSLAAVTGIAVGIVTGRSRLMNALLNPFIELIRPIPGIAWIPISILWFGTGETGKVFIIFISTFTMIAVSVHQGASSVDPALIGAAKMLGASRSRVFFTVVLPSCVPQIFTGLQTGLSLSWMVVLAAEMIRSEFGVGWVITAGNNSYNMAQVLVGIIAIGIIGLVLANALRALERRLCAWKEG